MRTINHELTHAMDNDINNIEYGTASCRNVAATNPSSAIRMQIITSIIILRIYKN